MLSGVPCLWTQAATVCFQANKNANGSKSKAVTLFTLVVAARPAHAPVNIFVFNMQTVHQFFDKNNATYKLSPRHFVRFHDYFQPLDYAPFAG